MVVPPPAGARLQRLPFFLEKESVPAAGAKSYPKGKDFGNQIFANSLELFLKMDDH
jgi:hypothetical protein